MNRYASIGLGLTVLAAPLLASAQDDAPYRPTAPRQGYGTPAIVAPPPVPIRPTPQGDRGMDWTPTALTAPARPTVITSPDWQAKPTDLQIDQAFPVRAARLNVNGSATISCIVADDGRLANCAVVAEAPTGYGFGEAALSLSPKYRMKLTTSDGASAVGAKVLIPLKFAFNSAALGLSLPHPVTKDPL